MEVIQFGLESHWHAVQSRYQYETKCGLRYDHIRYPLIDEGWPTCPDCIRALPPREPTNLDARLASLERIADELVGKYREQAQILMRVEFELERLKILVRLLQNEPASATGGPGNDFPDQPGS